LTTRPRCSAILGSKSVFLRAFSCASVPSSSIPIKRQEPATSAARIAASRRSTCSLLKMHPRGSGKLNVHIAQLRADVRLCSCPKRVILIILSVRRSLPRFPCRLADILRVSRHVPKVPQGALFARFKMKEAGGGQLKSLRSFLRISLRSSAYSSTIRRASCVREGLVGGSGPEVGLSSCGISERTFEVCSTLVHRQQRGTPLFVVDLHQGMSVRGHQLYSGGIRARSAHPRTTDMQRLLQHVGFVPTAALLSCRARPGLARDVRVDTHRQGVVMPCGFIKPLSRWVASKSLHLAAVWKVG
jgi:hypothetical protein